MVQRILLVIVLLFVASFCFADDFIMVADGDTLREASSSASLKISLQSYLNIDLVMRRQQSRFLSGPSKPELPALDVYRHSYHAVGLQDLSLELSRSGFSTLPSVWSKAFVLQSLDTFFYQGGSLRKINYHPSYYESEVLAADIQAGLGDYEFNFARGKLRKNGILGINKLYYNLDFLARTGLWTGIDHKQSSHKHRLCYDYGDYRIDFEYLDFAQDNSSQDLLPLYWLPVNQVLDYRKRDLRLGFNTPFVNLAFLQEDEDLADLGIETKHLHYMLSKRIKWQEQKLSVAWEKVDSDYEITPINTAAERAFEDRLSLDADLRLPLPVTHDSYLSSKFAVDLYDWEDPRLEGSLDFETEAFALGVYALENPQESVLRQAVDIFNPGSMMDASQQVLKRDLALRLSWCPLRTSTYFDIKLQAGLRDFDKVGSYLGTDYDSFANLAYIDLSASLDKAWGPYTFCLFQSFKYQQEDDYTAILNKLTELPRFRSQTHLVINRDMGNDNNIFGGFGLHAHDRYFTARALPTEIGASAILDLFAGVDITKSFEFIVSFKNALNTDIYGTYPIPQSLHASLHWYFLN